MKDVKQNKGIRGAGSGLFLQPAVFSAFPGRGWAAFLMDCLLLFFGLFGAAWAFLSAFSLPVDPVFPLVLAASFALLFTAAYRWRFADVILFVLAAGLCVFLWRFQEEIVQGFLVTANCMMAAFTANSPYAFPTFVTETAGEEEAARCAAFFVGVCMVPVAGALSWATVRRRSFVFSFLFTFPFVLPALFFTITPDLRAMALLLFFWGAQALFSRKGRRSGGKRDPAEAKRLPAGAFFPALLLALVIGGLFLAVPPQNYERPPQVEEWRAALEDTARDLSRRAVDAVRYHGSRDETELSELQPDFSGQTVLEVRSTQVADLYLRGFTGSVYNGDGWGLLPDEAYAELRNAQGSFSTLNLPGLLAQYSAGEMQVSVRNVGGDRGILYFPYYLTTQPEQFPAAQYVDDASLRGNAFTAPQEYTLSCLDPGAVPLAGSRSVAAELYAQNALGENSTQLYRMAGFYLDGSEGSRLAMEALYREPVPASLSLPEPVATLLEEEATYSSFVYDHYLDVPEELRTRLLDAFAVESGPLEFNDAITWVEDVIRRSGTYTLDAPLPPGGEDFVSYFLFTSREGYCVHFASSAVLLLRSLGIPARYVEGFPVTAEELFEAGGGGWASITDSRAHAWAEAYCPGFGWVPVEATPGGTAVFVDPAEIEDPVSLPEPVSSAAPSSEPEAPSSAVDAVSSRPVVSGDPSEEEEGAPSPVWGVLLRALAALFCAALLVLLFLLRRAVRGRRFDRLPPNRAVRSMYRYALSFARFGVPMDGELRRLAEKVKFSRFGVNEEERRAALAALDRMRREAARTLPLWKRALLFLLAG